MKGKLCLKPISCCPYIKLKKLYWLLNLFLNVICTFKLMEFIIMSNGDEKIFSCRDLRHYANPYLPIFPHISTIIYLWIHITFDWSAFFSCTRTNNTFHTTVRRKANRPTKLSGQKIHRLTKFWSQRKWCKTICPIQYLKY